MDLEKEVLSIIDNSGYDVAVYLDDMHGNVIAHNENVVYCSNSTIKAFILAEYFRQVYAGEISEDDYYIYTEEDKVNGEWGSIIGLLGPGLTLTARQCAILMITKSDNLAANALIDFLGLDKINDNIRRMGFEHTELLHPIDLDKYDNCIGVYTQAEYARFYRMVYHGELISPDVSAGCLEVLKQQTLHPMLERGLPVLDMSFKGTPSSPINYIANKTGSMFWVTPDNPNQSMRQDGGIISTKTGDFIFAICNSRLPHPGEGDRIGGEIMKQVYNQILANNGKFR